MSVLDFSNQNIESNIVQPISNKIRTIGIISGKGGTGKTTTTINLCGAMQTFNQNVIAVDTDVKMSGLGLHLGVYNPKFTLNNVLKENINILEAIHIHSTGIRFLPASLKPENLNLSKLKEIFERYLPINSIVLIDSPPGLEENFIQVLKNCTEVVAVTTPDIQSITNSLKAVEEARKMGIKPLGVVLNRYRNENKSLLGSLESVFGIPLLGVIPDDPLIQKSSSNRMPAIFLKSHSKSSIEFKKIASRIIGIDYKPRKLDRFLGILRDLV